MNIQKQAESYAKSIAKNETYQRYLAAAFIAGVESKDVDSPITKEALLERGFEESCETNIGCFYERSDSADRKIEVTIYSDLDVIIFITDIRDGHSIPFPRNRTLEQLDSLIIMFLG